MGHTDRYTDCKENEAQLPQELGKHTHTYTLKVRPERKTQLKRLINEVERHTSSVELGLADGKRQTAKEKKETK